MPKKKKTPQANTANCTGGVNRSNQSVEEEEEEESAVAVEAMMADDIGDEAPLPGALGGLPPPLLVGWCLWPPVPPFLVDDVEDVVVVVSVILSRALNERSKSTSLKLL